MAVTQTPKLITATAEVSITSATSISVFASSGTTTVTGSGSVVLPEGIGLKFEATGDVLGTIIITPAEGATALISYFN